MEVLVESKQIYKSYYKDKKSIDVLNGLDLSIKQGEFLVILGRSGAGKSTLLHLLGALDQPTKGEIIFEKKVLSLMSHDNIARLRNEKIGFIFQFHHLLPEFTALENVMMPGLIGRKNNKDDLERRAYELLKEAGLEGRCAHYPGELSGGEEQRVAVVRALINNPILLLADEPTGDVDKETEQRIIGLLSSYNKEKGVTLVIVTHNPDIAQKADRKVFIEDGKIL